jgi:DNA-binding NtrC family response regulator
MYYLMQVIW